MNTPWLKGEYRKWGGGKMGEGSQKVQTSSYETNKSWDIMNSIVTIVHNSILHI